MQIEQVKEWYARMTEEERIKLIHEHWQMKQILCAQTLLVPTGTANWLQRAIRRAEHLTQCRNLLRKNLNTLTVLVEETTMAEFNSAPECSNCSGTGRIHENESCVCCHGSGKRVLSI